MNIRCLIVDDEPLALEGMELLVKEAGFLDLRASCASALEANQVLAREAIDLIFLDIQMPRIRGIDFLRGLKDPPLVIITTAYPHFALEGFELNVLDYLVKPIAPDRFLKSVNRARDVMDRNAEDYFFIKCNNGYEKIFYESIHYVEACQNYVTIHTAGEKYMTLTAMRSLEEQLPAGSFLRIHKSYIVAIGKIRSLNGNEVTVGQARIPVSKNYKEELMKIIDSKLIRK
ncbi:MAG TPA: LytTR family DNA-binding domain-containing protein [Puia sp.]|jgi:DNA-binding LytR/AlgR family response regulator|nr:LytTR family DNA-binding domain-containing protein [Puia sp.]